MLERVFEYIKPHIAEEELTSFINYQTIQGFTALHYASFRGSISSIKVLIQNGADYNILNFKSLSVIHLAAQGNQPNSLCYFKEKYKMNIESRDSLNSTPLNWACYTGSEIAVKYLLSWGVNQNSKDKEGLTPLHLAVISNKEKIIVQLLHMGADRKLKNRKGQTAYDLAIQNNKQAIADLFRNKSCNLYRLKVPLMKINKSSLNIIGFFLYHIFIVLCTICLFFQLLNEKMIEYFYYPLVAFEFFIYIMLLASSSVRRDIKPIKDSFLTLIEQKKVLANYCPTCVIEMRRTTKHCFICNVCVEHFDHHCYWINKCVGRKNYKKFILFLFWTCCDVVYNIAIDVMSKYSQFNRISF